MRTLFLSLLALGAPALAHASVDFKCESVKPADQVGGWLHFGYAGANGAVQLEFWNGYPPITLVDANLDAGVAIAPGGTRFTSDADRDNGATATIDLPLNYLTADKFLAKVVLGKARYALSCVRH